jgi:hypothetical protein
MSSDRKEQFNKELRAEILQRLRPYLLDVSLWTLVLGNFYSIYLAFAQDWPLGEILWIYWAQSVIIGISNYIRMMSLKEFTTGGMQAGGKPVPETPEGKRMTANFFAIHFGLFHFVYAVFLYAQMPLDDIPPGDILLLGTCVGAFALSHGFSLVHNGNKDFRAKKPDIGLLLFYPYLRIVPMHLVIIFGTMITMLLGDMGESIVIVLFMLMKTVADGLMHMAERFIFQAPPGFFDRKPH